MRSTTPSLAVILICGSALALPVAAQDRLSHEIVGLTLPRLTPADSGFPGPCADAMTRVDTLMGKGFSKPKRYRTLVSDGNGRHYEAWLFGYRRAQLNAVFTWTFEPEECQHELAYGHDTYATLMYIHSIPSTRADTTDLYAASDSTLGLPVLPGGTAPKAVTLPQPDYPEPLRMDQIEGSVLVDMVIDTAGRVEPWSLQVVSSTHLAFEPSTFWSLRKGIFQPARVQGRPVRAVIRQRYSYTVR